MIAGDEKVFLNIYFYPLLEGTVAYVENILKGEINVRREAEK